MEEDLSAEQWAYVLALSDMYRFPRVRARAVQHLDKLMDGDPVRRLVLARQFNIDSWLSPALESLVCREKSLSLKEGHEIGMETVIKIADFRERCYYGSSEKWKLKSVRGQVKLDIKKELARAFRLE